MHATRSTPFANRSSACSTKPGRWMRSHPGVKAPGTPKRTVRPLANSSPVFTGSGIPFAPGCLISTSGIASPAAITASPPSHSDCAATIRPRCSGRLIVLSSARALDDELGRRRASAGCSARRSPLIRCSNGSFPDDATRLDATAAWLGLFVERYVSRTPIHVIADDQVDAVAIWQPPGETALPVAVGPPTIGGLLGALLGTRANRRARRRVAGDRFGAPDSPALPTCSSSRSARSIRATAWDGE